MHGSQLLFMIDLKNMVMKSKYCANSYPNFLKFLPFIFDVLIYEDDEEKCMEIINKTDTFFF